MPAPDEKETAAATGRRARKQQQQEARLADTAWQLFEAEGFEAVTMARIAEAADVSKVTLYRHFPVKEALLSHVFHRELRETWPAIQPELARMAPGKARLGRFLQLQAAWCESRRAFLLPYVRFRLADSRFPGAGRTRSGMDQMFSVLIAEGQATGEFRRDYPVELLTLHFQYAHLATLLRWLACADISLAEAFSEMLELFCHGMEARQ